VNKLKFDELFEELEMAHVPSLCSCCRSTSTKLAAYKCGNKLVLLCERCEEFLRELLE